MSSIEVDVCVFLGPETKLGQVKAMNWHDSFRIRGGDSAIIVFADSVEAIDRLTSRLAELREAVAKRRAETTPPEPTPEEPL